jgi:hypothetical protein
MLPSWRGKTKVENVLLTGGVAANRPWQGTWYDWLELGLWLCIIVCGSWWFYRWWRNQTNIND